MEELDDAEHGTPFEEPHSSQKGQRAPETSPRPEDIPSLLLASHVISATSYASLMYSIARVTAFGFQPGIQLSRMNKFLAFALPTGFSLAAHLGLVLVSDPPVNVNEEFIVYWNYKIGQMYWLPAAVAGTFTFLKRLFIESVLSTYLIP